MFSVSLGPSGRLSGRVYNSGRELHAKPKQRPFPRVSGAATRPRYRHEITRAEPVMGMCHAEPGRNDARLPRYSVYRMDRPASFIAHGIGAAIAFWLPSPGVCSRGGRGLRTPLFPVSAPVWEFRPARIARRWSVSWWPTRCLMAAPFAGQMHQPPKRLVSPVFVPIHNRSVPRTQEPSLVTRSNVSFPIGDSVSGSCSQALAQVGPMHLKHMHRTGTGAGKHQRRKSWSSWSRCELTASTRRHHFPGAGRRVARQRRDRCPFGSKYRRLRATRCRSQT